MELNRIKEIQSQVEQQLPPTRFKFTGLGLGLILLLLLAAVGSTFLIRYSDVVVVPIRLTYKAGETDLRANTSGKISVLWVENKDFVEKNQRIAFMGSEVDLAQVDSLQIVLNKLLDADLGIGKYIEFPLFKKLGRLEVSYSALNQAIQQYNFFKERNTSFQKIQSLERQIGHIESLNKTLREQEKVMSLIADLALKELTRMQALGNEAAITMLEKERAEINFLQYRRQQEAINIDILNNNVRIEEITIEVLDLKESLTDQGQKYFLQIKEKALQLTGEIQEWQLKHLVLAPRPGQIAYLKDIREGDYFHEGEQLMSLLPLKKDSNIIAKGRLFARNSGKLKEGQVANIHLSDLPSKEFGIIKGIVNKIALVSAGDYREIDILLPDGLSTSYGKRPSFRVDMEGMAKVQTAKRSLADRLFDRLKSIVKNR